MAKISIVTSGHFCSNPRVWREADALSAAGHNVTVIGICFDTEQAEIDQQMLGTRAWRYHAAADLRRHSFSSRVHREWSRIRSGWARFLLARNIYDPHALGYAVDRLLSSALKQNAELTISHLEPAMWVGMELHKRGYRVGVDVEDWYSESNMQAAKQRSRFCRELESEILQRATHATTTSLAMADALHEFYHCPKPEVIYNSVPSVKTVPFTSDNGPVRLIWFSQTVGEDRGLQDVFAALPLLEGNWTLELRAKASPAMRGWVESQVAPPLRSRVRIEGTVPPDDLAGVVAKYNIGLAPEPPSCRNKALTLSNKMFQYLQSGLLVAASDTLGQRELLSVFPEGGFCYPAGNPIALARILNSWLRDPAQLAERKEWIYRKANERFGYEHQAERLLDSVNRALEN